MILWCTAGDLMMYPGIGWEAGQGLSPFLVRVGIYLGR